MGKPAYLYIVTNRPYGTLYTGVTNNLWARIEQHCSGNGSAFTRTYNLKRLVYVEQHDRIEAAIAREKSVKRWLRDWKIALIEAQNPDWADLSIDLHLI